MTDGLRRRLTRKPVERTSAVMIQALLFDADGVVQLATCTRPLVPPVAGDSAVGLALDGCT